MHIIDKYIAKQIIISILLVSVALVGLDLFFSLVNELRVVGKGDYTLKMAGLYLLLTSPSHFYVMFPWAALLGSIICLGILASHSELVVLRTSGLSILRIAFAVVKGASILIVLMLIIGEGLAPTTERLAQHHRTLALTGGNSLHTPFGLWVRQNNAFIHVQTVHQPDELEGVTRYVFDDKEKLTEIQNAKTAQLKNHEWHLSQIKGTRFAHDHTETFQIPSLTVSTLLEPEILETAAIKHPERLSLWSLWRTMKHRIEHDLNAHTYALAFWSKVLKPIVIVLMVLLAVPFVFGPLRTSSMGVRILTGILIGFTFHTLNSLLGPIALVYQLPPLIAVLLPLGLFGGLGYLMIKRVR